MKKSLSKNEISSLRKKLKSANSAYLKNYPGESTGRQPVHTVYGGAQIFSHQVAQKLSEGAQKALRTHAPNAKALMEALNESNLAIWETVFKRVQEKIAREAVEDFRIDFEDGYGNRPDAEEDAAAENAAKEVAQGMKEGTLPPFIGIRIKPFNEERVGRALATMDIFLSTLIPLTNKKLPNNFVITLPKIQNREQVVTFEKALSAIEKKLKLKNGTVQCELMVETTQSIFDLNGNVPMRDFVEACKGRCRGAHFGTYDYTAGCSITATYQTMDNPVCDFAKHVLQVSLAGTDVMLSDGATNVMPVGDTPSVHNGWRLAYKHVRHSLRSGYYQGWDLHPAQLPIRYAAMYAFFLESYEQMAARLKGFVERAAKATLLGDVFDDAATGQGLLNYFLRGLSCGAITEAEARNTGLTIEEFQSRSFLKILENRKLV